MKYKVFIGLIFGGFLNIFAQSYINYPQDGIYGGIETGVALVIVNGTFSNELSAIDSEEFIGNHYTKNVVSINLGYGKYFGESFVGVEAHYSMYTKKISDLFVQNDFIFDISISSKSEIDLILGTKIGVKSLLTIRGGIAFSDINVIADSNFATEAYVLDKQWNGFSLGMGYVYGINENLSIKTKYNLTTFKNNKFPETNSKLIDNRATLSLIYRIWNEE